MQLTRLNTSEGHTLLKNTLLVCEKVVNLDLYEQKFHNFALQASYQTYDAQ